MPIRESCGAILYTIYNGKVGIVLGLEGNYWLPFKGCRDNGETREQTAIRELYEETCGLVDIKNISLHISFETKRKKYFIGCVPVAYSIINKFLDEQKLHKKEEFLEKQQLEFFELSIFENINSYEKFIAAVPATIHKISRTVIYGYYPFLQSIQWSLDNKYVVIMKEPNIHPLYIAYCNDYKQRLMLA